MASHRSHREGSQRHTLHNPRRPQCEAAVLILALLGHRNLSKLLDQSPKVVMRTERLDM